MVDFSKKIKRNDDGSTDFKMHLIVNYNGKKWHLKYDLGEACNDEGILPLKKWDKALLVLEAPFRGKFFQIGVLEQPPDDY